MKLKDRFQKIRGTLEGITTPFVIVSSLSTSDGGREGVLSQVSREIAAAMIVDQRCVIANEDQKAEFHRLNEEAQQRQLQELEQSRIRRELDFEALAGYRQQRGPK